MIDINNKLAALESQKNAPARSASPDVDIPRQVQSELKRVGCYSGEANGNWNSAAQRSMDLFNKYAGTKFDVKVASLDSLEVIKGRTGRICPLVCAHGFQVDGDTCTKITCKNGYEVGDDNTCERIIVRKPQPRAAPVARDYAPRRGPPQDDVVVRRGPPQQQNNDAAIIGGAIGGALLGGAIGGRW